ncbi:proteasome accessory factor PafA2 [Arthrobacter sp. KR32]|uniref:Proteasome accessory factor PafA2 n=2 Tax=Arthrobacter bussei TaxID=2594179 RepID=A0A7X1TNR2_9MICC|nr:depupylase/deamidase Dop [Arthrobacter bussei]MPY10855.1 proteasome accessory factor PafA2 [Arthrobacter bussei]
MGTETEYGIIAPALPSANPTLLSSQVVNAYAATLREGLGNLAGTRWDYTDETPLTDARGFRMDRARAHPSQLTDEPPELDELTAEQIALERGEPAEAAVLMNLVLNNGARLYVDHAHPEYSSPEVTNPLDAVLWDRAGDSVAVAAMERIAATPGFSPVILYKNNTDNKSVSYGSHENYLVPRSVPFSKLAEALIPFFVSRQVICGAGRVGLGALNQDAGFQISQRADFFENEIGLETTVRRPIINTRDEPHAVAEKYRRLHVIIGDANLHEVSNYLKTGTTALVLALIEQGRAPVPVLEDPVAALQSISHDASLTRTVQLTDGRAMSGLDLQELYCEAVTAALPPDADDQTRDVVARWQSLLATLRRDPMDAARQVDWIAKLSVLEAYRARDGLDWTDPRLALVDLQYADLRPDKGIYRRLARRGDVELLVGPVDVARAVVEPPRDTRAYFRGRCIAEYPAEVVGASWDSLIFELPGERRLQRVQTREPLRGTAELTGALFDAAVDAEDFLSRLLSGPERRVAP